MSIVEFDKVFFYFNQAKILKDISFRLDAGKTILIKGKSGVGKSTLINLIYRLIYPSDGEIRLFNQSIKLCNNIPYIRRNIGYIEQFDSLLSDCNVIENAMMPLLIQGIPYAEAFGRAQFLLDKFDIKQINQAVTTLSGGEKKRVMFVRSIIHSPKLILADEACSNLDKNNASKLIEELKTMQKEQDTAIIWVNHENDHAFDYSDEIKL